MPTAAVAVSLCLAVLLLLTRLALFSLDVCGVILPASQMMHILLPSVLIFPPISVPVEMTASSWVVLTAPVSELQKITVKDNSGQGQ